MGRRSERLSKQGMLASDLSGDGDVIQVVSRAFDVLRGTRGAARQSRNLQPLWTAALDGVAVDAHADTYGSACVSAA
jgi:hypothetical protein